MNEIEKSFLKQEHRDALEAAETLKAYCDERSENGNHCNHCIFVHDNECLLMTDSFTPCKCDPAPSFWRLDLCE